MAPILLLLPALTVRPLGDHPNSSQLRAPRGIQERRVSSQNTSLSLISRCHSLLRAPLPAPAMRATTMAGASQDQTAKKSQEPLDPASMKRLNLFSLRTRAVGLFKVISRILEDFRVIAPTNSIPKWQDVSSQLSIVNLELFNIVEDIKIVSKAFVVHPKKVNADNATILPLMSSSKLFPEMEAEDISMKELLLIGLQNLPITMQIEKLKTRIEMIGVACQNAENVITDTRKACGIVSRLPPPIVPTLDKVQSAKIQEQENILRAALNFGNGLRIPGDQMCSSSSLPAHLVGVLSFKGDPQVSIESAGGSQSAKNTLSSMPSSNVNIQGPFMQTPGAQQIGRSIPLPSGISEATLDMSTSPLKMANSLGSARSTVNTPSPLKQAKQQQPTSKLMQLPEHQKQLVSQCQLRQASAPEGRRQFGLSSGHPQWNHHFEILTDQVSDPGMMNPTNIVRMQQQQHGNKVGFDNISIATPNFQSAKAVLPYAQKIPKHRKQRQKQHSRLKQVHEPKQIDFNQEATQINIKESVQIHVTQGLAQLHVNELVEVYVTQVEGQIHVKEEGELIGKSVPVHVKRSKKWKVQRVW